MKHLTPLILLALLGCGASAPTPASVFATIVIYQGAIAQSNGDAFVRYARNKWSGL